MFKKIGGAVLIVGLMLTASGFSQEDKKADPLSGKQFKSVNKLERGLTPKGVALDHWFITFKKGTFTWNHSDVRESGTYVFDAETNRISASPQAGKLKYEGTFDPKTGVLTWMKEKYNEVKK
jgi:hypothetical protein